MKLQKLLPALVLSFALIGCARGGLRPEGGLLSSKSEGGLLNASSRAPSSESTSAGFDANNNSLDQEIQGVRLANKNFDIPVEYNEEVAQWVEYFTGNGRKHFAIYLERLSRFEPIARPKLKAAGLPEDLIYLAMIESGFSTQAKSHAGAVGPWQFMKSTGKIFGLKADWWVDERRDPARSTDAAIEYLGRLYAEFGDWRLACASYNSGELRIRNAISRLGTRDFWTIARNRKAIRRETKDYVPKMMAAALIGKNAEQFGFQTYPPDNSVLNYEEIQIPRAENLRTIAKVAKVNRETLAQMNPSLLRCCTPPQRGAYTIRVPKGESAALLTAAIEAKEIGRYADFRRHVIKRGDTLSRIASSHGVPVDAVLAMNDIHSVKALKPGMELVIPDRASASVGTRSIASSKPVIKASASMEESLSEFGGKVLTYVVQKGDTLYGISRRYAVRIDQIRQWNSIEKRAKNLRPGSRIKLYVKNDII